MTRRSMKKGRKMSDRASPIDRYTMMTQVLLKKSDVTQPTRKKGFGSSGLYTHGKLFAFLSYKNRLILKLPHERVNELVTLHKGTHWNPCRTGHGLREWVVLEPTKGVTWLSLAKEAKEFVASREPKTSRKNHAILEHS